MGIEVKPTETGFGAEIAGLDVSAPLGEAEFRRWREALERHGVVVLRGQQLTDEQHVAVSRRFGELEDFTDPKFQANGYPMVLRVSNVDRDTDAIKPLDDISHKSFTLGTSDWHIDSSYRHTPSLASLLYAREVPSDGGDTLFANTAMAYEALPDERKEQLSGVKVIHDFEHARRRFGLPPRPAAIRKANPPVTQPLVHRLADGRGALFIGMHAAAIDGMDEAPGRALLDWLIEWATQPQFVYRHRWRVGDLVMWDNRCTMHRATPYDMARERRVLHRTTVAGTAPVATDA